MNRLEQFEYPLPQIKTNIDCISINTSGGYEGSFIVENVGGSELEGYVTSNSKMLVVSPRSFKGNKVEIHYDLSLDSFRPGDFYYSSLIITSNGGEVILPVSISIITPEIVTKEGIVISSLHDFYDYAFEHSVSARQLFTQHDFMMWLFNMSYKDMELYEKFVKDPNKERAVDNFLILNDLKEQATVFVENKHNQIVVKPESHEPETMSVKIYRTDWGFVDVELKNSKGEDIEWLQSGKAKLSSADFNEEDVAELFYVVLPDKMESSFVSEKIEVFNRREKVTEFYIHATKTPQISVELNKTSYSYDDRGYIKVINKSGEDLKIEVFPEDGFVRFASYRFFASDRADIPFDVKVNPFQAAQFLLRKVFSVQSCINIRITSSTKIINKKLYINLGGINNIPL